MRLVALLLGSFLPLIAQTTGAIEGVVTDPSGAAVPGAGVKLTHAATGVIRGPGFAIWDASAAKQFPIREKLRLRYAAEFFNFLNHTNWSGVGTAFGSGNYAQITSARDPRKMQMSLRLTY